MADKYLSEEKQAAARRQGDAYTAALAIMQDDVDVHRTKEVDDYIVTLACEEAEGMYRPVNDESLEWSVPEASLNKHIEIAVQDRKDHRFVPDLRIHATITSSDGAVAFDGKLPFLWHPFLWHYGCNIHIDGSGDYDIAVVIEQPHFGRHDEQNGKRYQKEVSMSFEAVPLEPGREPHGAE